MDLQIPMALPQTAGLLADAARMAQDAQRLVAGTSPAEAGGGPAGGFADALRRVDAQDQAAAAQVAAVERGDSDDLVGAMLASQQASLSFSMLMQVRNKVVGALDELVKLPL